MFGDTPLLFLIRLSPPKKSARLLFCVIYIETCRISTSRSVLECCEVRFLGSRDSFKSADSFSSSWANLIGMDYKTWITMSWSSSFSVRASERFGPSSVLITIQSFAPVFKPTRSWLRVLCLLVRRQKTLFITRNFFIFPLTLSFLKGGEEKLKKRLFYPLCLFLSGASSPVSPVHFLFIDRISIDPCLLRLNSPAWDCCKRDANVPRVNRLLLFSWLLARSRRGYLGLARSCATFTPCRQ